MGGTVVVELCEFRLHGMFCLLQPYPILPFLPKIRNHGLQARPGP